MRLFLTAILSLFAGLASHLLLVFFVLGDPLSFEDLMGVGVMSVAYSLVVFSLVYLPGLLWLRQRLPGCEPAHYFPLFTGLVLNLPVAVFVLLWHKLGGVFSTGEAVLFVIQFIVAGAVFGAGFVWHSRRQKSNRNPATVAT